MADTIRVLIADHQPIFRCGLRKAFEAEPGLSVVGEAGDGSEAIRLTGCLKPDVMLLDLGLPQRAGLTVLRDLAFSALPVRVLVLAGAAEKAQIAEALQLGAYGAVPKESPMPVVVESIRSVAGGKYWLGQEFIASILQTVRENPPTQPPRQKAFALTQREREIISRIVAGCSNKDIGRSFSISERTVKHHLTNIFEKLGVSTRVEFAVFALHHQVGTTTEPARG